MTSQCSGVEAEATGVCEQDGFCVNICSGRSCCVVCELGIQQYDGGVQVNAMRGRNHPCQLSKSWQGRFLFCTRHDKYGRPQCHSTAKTAFDGITYYHSIYHLLDPTSASRAQMEMATDGSRTPEELALIGNAVGSSEKLKDCIPLAVKILNLR